MQRTGGGSVTRQEIISRKSIIREQIISKRKEIAELETEIKPLKYEMRELDKKLDLLNHKKMF